jgi:hypothetical protein
MGLAFAAAFSKVRWVIYQAAVMQFHYSGARANALILSR